MFTKIASASSTPCEIFIGERGNAKLHVFGSIRSARIVQPRNVCAARIGNEPVEIRGFESLEQFSRLLEMLGTKTRMKASAKTCSLENCGQHETVVENPAETFVGPAVLGDNLVEVDGADRCNDALYAAHALVFHRRWAQK